MSAIAIKHDFYSAARRLARGRVQTTKTKTRPGHPGRKKKGPESRFSKQKHSTETELAPASIGAGSQPKGAERACRRCGCTWTTACLTVNGPCCWVEKDLCSACLTRPEAMRWMAGHKNPSRGVFGKVSTRGRRARTDRKEAA